MKELLVISGKGGTGKTSIVGALSALAGDKIMADCDVDASNLHLLLNPVVQEQLPFYGLKKARIDPELCVKCGYCAEYCRFDAIKHFEVEGFSCEGCGVCRLVCPEEAVKMEDHLAGHIKISETVYGPLVYAKLGIAEENSGKLVAAVRKEARQIAEKKDCRLIITDGPPGIGCPVISCLPGADMVMIVTEPTNSGIHDLDRVLRLVEHFEGKAVVCINKWDISCSNSEQIECLCLARNIPVVGRIPYDPAVYDALKAGRLYMEYDHSPAAEATLNIWDGLTQIIYRK